MPKPIRPQIIGAAQVFVFKDLKTGGPENQWVGFSQFLPGGGAGPDSTPFEKVYVVLEGEMTVEIDGQETVLSALDSCTIAPGVVRRIENKTNHICKMLVVMPYPGGQRPE